MRYLKSFNESKDELLYHEIDSFNSVTILPAINMPESDKKFIIDLVKLILLKQEVFSEKPKTSMVGSNYKFAEISPYIMDRGLMQFSIIWNRLTSMNDIQSYSASKKNTIYLFKDNDDYYYLAYMTSTPNGAKTYSYKCDQLEGLNQCLNFVLNNK